MKYTFEMPEISGEDWSRLLANPTVISFLQGYSSVADNRMLNVYALAGGELVENYHYFIWGDTYHCIESDPNVTKSTHTDTVTYQSEGRTKIVNTTYVSYYYYGSEIMAIYNTQTECAQKGAYPCDCVTNWHM